MAKSFAPGDVVLVPFPFTSQSGSKKRPAVVLSSRLYNADRPDVILAPITSRLHPQRTLGEVLVQDWKTCGLVKPSVVKPAPAALEQGLVLQHIGLFSRRDWSALMEALKLILG